MTEQVEQIEIVFHIRDRVKLNAEGAEGIGRQIRGTVWTEPTQTQRTNVLVDGKVTPTYFATSLLEKLTPEEDAVPLPVPMFPVVRDHSSFETIDNNVVIVATNPAELEAGQKTLIASIRAKETEANKEIAAALEMVNQAIAAGISVDAAKRLVWRAENRARYLCKIATALEAGYVMVPNFPGDTIAVRVKRQGPRGPIGKGTTKWQAESNICEEAAERLPVGEGRYVDPMPFIENDAQKNERQEMVHTACPIGLDDDIDLPAEFHKPLVVKRLGTALAAKIFDEIVIAPGPRMSSSAGIARGDPMVLGRILAAPRQRWSGRGKMLTFLIAWFQDTSVI